tara:strand:- start:37 stop:225 length:189 start_codon:yes stop_codon:yes gene_type:complete
VKTYEVFCTELRRFSVLVEAEDETQATKLVYEDINKYKVVSEDITDKVCAYFVEKETSNEPA